MGFNDEESTLKNVLRSALLAAAVVTMAGCTGAAGLLNQIPGGVLPSGIPSAPAGTTPTGTTATTAPTTTTTTTTPTAAPNTSTTTAASCTRTSPSGTPDLLSGTAYGKFNGQHVPATWGGAYHTEKEVWDAINSNSSLTPADWACFQKFYPGAYTAWKDLASTYGG
ncbi:MAG: hypothetical protein JWM80_3734 [Cyanobacteria bacterium RYN_339]|nr:hypothetical protein [Cyanobacteria bacterium RYN_339]